MLTYISQLQSIDRTLLDSLVSEVQAINIDWQEPYGDYGSAGMKIATLLNPTGEQYNFDYRDCENPQPTPLLKQLPSIAGFLKNTGLKIMGSRLLRLDPGTFLHEHRDFVYLESLQRLRLHLPLITNNKARIISPGTGIHFQQGYLWKLDPKATVHSACNFGQEPRVHLMLDCYANEVLTDLLKKETFDQNCIVELPLMSNDDKATLLAKARLALGEGQLKAAEEILLRSFCEFNLQNTTSYDLIFELFANNKQYADRADYWQTRLKEVYYINRDKEEKPEPTFA